MVDCQAVYADFDISSAQFLTVKEKSSYILAPNLAYMNAEIKVKKDGIRLAYMNASTSNSNCNSYFCVI